MAWEIRRGRKYYYRKVREGRQVRSIYVGASENASHFAELDAQINQSSADERATTRRMQEFYDEAGAQVERLASIVETLMEGVLLAAGFHTHKREWRRERREKNGSN